MLFHRRAQICCLLTLLCASAIFGQVVTSSVVGVLNDPAKAVVPGAQVELTDQATGAVRTTESQSSGIFRFTNVPPGAYTITVKAQGFKSYAQKGINLVASETRDLGTIVLEIGALVEEISVTAQATPVQTASSEKAATIENKQLQNIAIKGRDLFGMLAMLPGVSMTGTGVETTNPYALGAVSINGGGGGGANRSSGGTSSAANFTVDGVTNMDTGGNMIVQYEPNMDSIAEIRVLTSNYSAEYGRNSRGTISVITKGGGQQFHGSGWWNKRNEALNANDFFKNKSNTPRTRYRYDVAGFSLGGPVYIPKTFNTQKKYLFFFVSQEYSRQTPNVTPGFANVPTALERAGNFSQSRNSDGSLLVIKDPSTGLPFASNTIQTPLNPGGLAALNFFPLPNYVDPDPKQLYQRNYKNVETGPYPRRNDMVRIDTHLTSKLSGYFRYGNDSDFQKALWSNSYVNYIQLLDTKDNTWKTYGRIAPLPGHGYAVSMTYIITPTMINEATFGQSYSLYAGYVLYPGQLDRSKLNLPHWYKDSDIKVDNLSYALYTPGLSFGSTPANAVTSPGGSSSPSHYPNTVYSFSDNVSKTTGRHNLKFGVYYERAEKVQQGSNSYLGSYNFGHDANWRTADGNTGDGFANALLGTINTYSEQPKVIGDYWFMNLEFYAQDSWRVTKRLTLDFGVRFAHLSPYENTNMTSGMFTPSLWSAGAAPRFYYPYTDASGKRWAWDRAGDPNKLALAPGPLVGSYVPGSGNFANGMQIKRILYQRDQKLFAAPRLGFAWDVFGTGKTAVRGGVGQFTNREGGNVYYGTAGQPPVTYNSSLYYSNIALISSASGAQAPTSSMNALVSNQPYEYNINGSIGVQQNLGFGAVLDVAYVGAFTRHGFIQREINPIPMWSRFDPANTVSGRLLTDNFFRPYVGLGGIIDGENAASVNYHGLQTSLQRRFSNSLSFGAAYTFSKVLSTMYTSAYFSDRARNYGLLPQDRSHVLVLNYVYELPKFGTRLGSKALGAVTDGWTISGVMNFSSGQPFSPAVTVQDKEWTGSDTSTDSGRFDLVANPNLPRSEKTFSQAFNTAAFVLPEPCSWTNQTTACFGNAGLGIVRGPGINNWDMTLSKNIPLGLGERRTLRFRAEAYNLWNHTQFGGVGTGYLGVASGVDATATFRGGKNINTTFGSYTSNRPARILSASLRFEF